MATQKLFGSSGIRGEAVSYLTDQFCFDLGRVFAILLTKHQQPGWIAVGMDPRDSSERIKNAFIKGLRTEGRSTYDDGIIPIPAINWALRSDASLAGSVMITGSHIKAHLNGLKFFMLGNEILKTHEEEIQTIYDIQKERIPITSYIDNATTEVKLNTSHVESYITYLLSKSNRQSKSLKITLDAGNGAQSSIGPRLLSELGHQVVEMNTDTTKELYSRDTEVSGDFSDLQKMVIETKSDLGIGFDSDGDRVIFIDDNGSFIPGDYSGALIARSYDTVSTVTPVNTSQVIDKINKTVYRTKVGSPFVVGKMQEVGALFGFEANGGGIFSDMYSRDGGRSIVEFLNIMHAKNLSASKLVDTLPKFYILREKIDYDLNKKDEIINKAMSSFKGISTDNTDGLKIWVTDDTWILFRSSANAPEFRIFVESPSEDKANQLMKDGIDLIKDYSLN